MTVEEQTILLTDTIARLDTAIVDMQEYRTELQTILDSLPTVEPLADDLPPGTPEGQ